MQDSRSAARGAIPSEIATDRRKSSLRQIHRSIECHRLGEYDCAITLAGAAECMLPSSDLPYLWKQLRQHLDPEDLNAARDWLKHSGAEKLESVTISRMHSAFMVARAVSKYVAVYLRTTSQIEQFLGEAHEEGHLPDFRAKTGSAQVATVDT